MVAASQGKLPGQPRLREQAQAKPLGQRLPECVSQCRKLLILLGAGIALLLFGASHLPPQGAWGWIQGAGGLAVGLVLLGAMIWILWRDYIEPIGFLRNWVFRMRGGDLSARMPVPAHGAFTELGLDLNSLGEMLQSLARDTEQQLQHYTEHTNHKTRSLSILYDIAASINESRDLGDLLQRCLRTLTDVVNARAGAVRLLMRDGQMRLVASVGLDDDMIEREQVLPAQSCLCGQAVVNDGVLIQSDMTPCSRRVGRSFFGGDEQCAMVVVPLQYRGRTLGVYNLYLEGRDGGVQQDFNDLLTSVGRHLGMAIDKSRLDEEANRLSIMEERTRLAHELHDSLAQTLASVRFQIRVLDETLHQDDEAATWEQLEKIENSIDEANTELRELIAHFRAPVDKRGLLPSVEQTVMRFRQQCPDTHVFLQKEWPDSSLPPEYEVQVLRVIQEALANVRKHGQANAVRVMLRGDSAGRYRVLIEDDGVGMGEVSRSEAPGEHLGLSIMEDRARKLGGKLQIESEPGEGVRVVLTFRHPKPSKDESRRQPESVIHGTARTRH